MSPLWKLSPDKLRRITDPATLEGIEESDSGRSYFIGQERAVAALRFGLRVRGSGFNVFAAGSSGTGKETLVRRYCAEIACDLPRPGDWCYVHSFSDPGCPRAIRIEPGQGPVLAREMKSQIRDIRRDLKRAFRAEPFQRMRDDILREVQEVQDAEMLGVDEVAASNGFRVERRPESFITVPIHHDGEPLSPEVYSGLDQEKRSSLAQRERDVTASLKAAITRIEEVEEAAQERMNILSKLPQSIQQSRRSQPRTRPF